jgi:hypothetical protein
MILNWFVRHKRFGRFKKAFDRRTLPARDLSSFPRTIHIYWHQGFANGPELVSACIASWKDRNPTWTIRLWDGPAADRLVSRSSLPDGLKITPYSDILRTEILKQHGGVWADATVYCTRALDSWLLQIMCQTDFFAFSQPGPDRAIASWFLAARPNSPVVTELSRAVARFWSSQDKPTRVYHWFQYIFEYLERTSSRFRRAWHTAPRIAAEPLLYLQLRLTGAKARAADEPDLLKALPMHKLSHKVSIDVEEVERLVAEFQHAPA